MNSLSASIKASSPEEWSQSSAAVSFEDGVVRSCPYSDCNPLGRQDVYLRGVTYFRQLGVWVLLLASFLSPAMACLVPDAPMTTEERACCRMMQNQCGQMGMPASHGCCQKTPANVYDRALTTQTAAMQPVAVPVIWLSVSELVNPLSSVAEWSESSDHSPPHSPPSTISILKI